MFETYHFTQQLGRTGSARPTRRPPVVAAPPVAQELRREGDYMTSAEALQRLGVKQQTLYAYVSRGLIRSLPHVNGRSRYYLRDDVERVRERGSKRYGPDFVATGAMRGSQAVIDTVITEITRKGPSYRGRPAIDLAAAGIRFENVAEFLWGGEFQESPLCWVDHSQSGLPDMLALSSSSIEGQAHILQLMCFAVLGLGIASGTRGERNERGLSPLDVARQILRAQAAALGSLGPQRKFMPVGQAPCIAAAVLQALGADPSLENERAVNSLLTVVADHELHPATFAARVAASTSNDMHSCVCAALSTLHGTLLGRACDRVEELFEPSASLDEVMETARSELRAAKGLPGFNHPFYPDGDPRARFLIEQALRMAGADSEVVHTMYRTLRPIEAEFGIRPSIEFGLVMLCRALRLPSGSASGLHALGFTSGWVAHILEQRKSGFIIRPRAKYTGPVPTTDLPEH